jgi:hypothetical protein
MLASALCRFEVGGGSSVSPLFVLVALRDGASS